MASKIPMQVYEETTLTHTDDHLYEPITIDKKENSVNLSRKQWFNIFLLMLAGSLVSFGLGSTVTYFTIHSVIDLQVTNLDRGTDEVSNISISQTLKTIIRERELIDLKMLNLERRINEQSKASKNPTEVVREHTQKGGFTACMGYMRSDGRIKFTSVKSSHGISMISAYRDGKFIAPKAGFYLVLSNILSKSQKGFFIRKNGTEIASAWSHYFDSDKRSYYNAPLLAFTELSVNDVITIEGKSLDPSSCLTIVQL